jgi:hypothetical protein
MKNETQVSTPLLKQHDPQLRRTLNEDGKNGRTRYLQNK